MLAKRALQMLRALQMRPAHMQYAWVTTVALLVSERDRHEHVHELQGKPILGPHPSTPVVFTKVGIDITPTPSSGAMHPHPPEATRPFTVTPAHRYVCM